MKQCIKLGTAGFILCSSAYANTFYTGINLGINSLNNNKQLTYPLGGTSFSSFNYTPSYTGFYGQLYWGTTVFNNTPSFNLALQADADLFSGTTHSAIMNWFGPISSESQEKLRYGLGLFALPQYHWKPGFTVFAGPGWVYSQLVNSSGYTAGNLGVTGGNSAWISGWAIKLGTANRIKNNLEVLLSYQYNHYQSSTQENIEPLTQSLVAVRYQPRANLFSLGLRYHA